MIKVSDVVLDLLQTDELALESLRAGLLNLSAYAKKIQPKVENITYKEIKLGTIVVSLSRLAKSLPPTSPLYPEVKIENLSFKSSLVSLTFEKNADIERKVAVLHPFRISSNDLYALIEGPSEVTLICSEKSKEELLKHFQTKPKIIKDDLVAITAQFEESSNQTPNILYTLLASLAAKRINLIELISTTKETSFIVEEKDLEEAVKILNTFFAKKQKIN